MAELKKASEIPGVLVPDSGRYIFVAAELPDESGAIRSWVVRAYQRTYSKEEADARLQDEMRGVNVSCIGGGIIHIDPDDKIVEIFSDDIASGEESVRLDIVLMLEKKFPGFNVTASGLCGAGMKYR